MMWRTSGGGGCWLICPCRCWALYTQVAKAQLVSSVFRQALEAVLQSPRAEDCDQLHRGVE